MDKLAFEIGIADGMKIAAIDVRNFRILPTADSREEEIEKAVSGHKARAKGDYGTETAKTTGRYGLGGGALGAATGALGGLMKGHGRTQMAKKMEKMSPKERKAFLKDHAFENRHKEMMSAMAYR